MKARAEFDAVNTSPTRKASGSPLPRPPAAPPTRWTPSFSTTHLLERLQRPLDEGTNRLCQTACGSGFERCVGGSFLECDAPQPGTELCDGIDNNCNGEVDEGCGCVNGDQRRCGTDVGECRAGRQYCVDGQWGVCEGELTPANDDPCDGVDNDCDGTVDEYCHCADGQTRACGSSLGICEPGMQTCEGGVWGPCLGATLPQNEVCDNVDNNCDGDVDNGATCGSTLACRCGTCVGPCGTGGACPTGAECVAGFCVVDTCPPGSRCDGFQCVPDSGNNGGGGGDGSTEDPDGGLGPRGKKGVSGVDGGCRCNAMNPIDVGLVASFLFGLRLFRRRRR